MNSFIKFCRDRVRLNLTIDIILFLLLMVMAGIGLLIKYTLLSGEKRNLIYGENINLELWGMDRHQWGTIHLIVSITFVLFILLHIIFHWKMIVCFFKKLFPKQIPRTIIITLISVFGAFLFVFAFIIEPSQVHYGNLYRHRAVGTAELLQGVMQNQVVVEAETKSQKANKTNEKIELESSSQLIGSPQDENHLSDGEKLHRNHKSIDSYEVFGSQTISQVASKYLVPDNFICKELGVPSHSDNERLGRLRRRYNFNMSDVSRAIAKYKNNAEE